MSTFVYVFIGLAILSVPLFLEREWRRGKLTPQQRRGGWTVFAGLLVTLVFSMLYGYPGRLIGVIAGVSLAVWGLLPTLRNGGGRADVKR
jgi:hypothetical protein